MFTEGTEKNKKSLMEFLNRMNEREENRKKK